MLSTCLYGALLPYYQLFITTYISICKNLRRVLYVLAKYVRKITCRPGYLCMCFYAVYGYLYSVYVLTVFCFVETCTVYVFLTKTCVYKLTIYTYPFLLCMFFPILCIYVVFYSPFFY